jgi:hypothetical protein
MAFGLPSAEEMRDYLISQGVDPVVASERANVAARQNAAQATRTSALSVLAGAAPARAAGTAAIEAAPAIGRGAVSIGERIAAAPRNVWEYLTVPQGVVRNPTTGARIPTRNVATGRMERTPDYFLPGQQLAQGTTGAVALGGGAAGTSALMDRPAVAPIPVIPIDGSISGEEGGGTSYQRALMDGSISGEEGGGTSYLSAAQAAGERAGLPPARPTETALQIARQRATPLPPTRPEEFKAPSGGLASLFSGKDYQSANALSEDPRTRGSSAPVVQDGRINWGDSDSAADFFRADKALLARKAEEGMNRGGAASGKPDKNEAIHRALDIISHLVGHRR